MKIGTILKNGIYVLREKNIEDSVLASKILLASILNIRREELIYKEMQEATKEEEEAFFAGIGKIAIGYPVQYLTKYKEFMKMRFFVNENVLIPRSDTETLVEEAILHGDKRKDILELCTGSGAISISIANNLDGAKIIATDISESALDVAKYNFSKLAKNKSIEFIISDMFDSIEGVFDMIVSNPPYIKTKVIDEYNLKYEPKIALDGRGGWT